MRKCARSWATQLQYLSLFPDYVFAASQAVQYAWIKQHYPPLWTSLKRAVTEGRFVPTGGTWVEMVCSSKTILRLQSHSTAGLQRPLR